MNTEFEKLVKRFMQESRRTLAAFLRVTPDKIKHMREYNDLEPAVRAEIQNVGVLESSAWLDAELAPPVVKRPPRPTPEPHVVALATDIEKLPDEQIATFFGMAVYQITRLRNTPDFVPEMCECIRCMGYTTTKNRIGV